MMLNIEATFDYKVFDTTVELIEMLVNAHPQNHDLQMRYDRRGRPVKLANLLKKLKGKTTGRFSLDTEDSLIVFVNSANNKFGHLLMDNIIANEQQAENWLLKVFDYAGFLQARVYDDDYDTWQNATDLDYYKSFGKSLDGLKLIHNGYPPPLDAMEVDISDHPGRKVFRHGYLEMLGSPMWFSHKMLEMVDSDIAGLKKLDWLTITEVNANVIKLERKDGVLCSDVGEQKEQQNILRSLLYRKVIEEPSQQQGQEYSDHATEITIDGETFVRKGK